MFEKTQAINSLSLLHEEKEIEPLYQPEEMLKRIETFSKYENLIFLNNNSFNELLIEMDKYSNLNDLIQNETLFNFWKIDISLFDGFSLKLKQKVALEQKNKFYFAWIFGEEGINKITKSWSTFIGKMDCEKIVQIICSTRLKPAFDSAELKKYNSQIAKSLIFKFCKEANWANFFERFILIPNLNYLSNEYSSFLFECKTNFINENSRLILRQASIWSSNFSNLRQIFSFYNNQNVSFNSLLLKQTKWKRNKEVFGNVSDLDLLNLSFKIFKLQNKKVEFFDIIKLLLNEKIFFLDTSKVLMYDVNQLNKVFEDEEFIRQKNFSSSDMVSKLLYSLRSDYDINFLNFYQLANSHDFKGCLECRKYKQQLKQLNTEPNLLFVEHIIEINNSINKIDTFESKTFETKKFKFHYLHNAHILKRAALELKNCMYTHYASTLKSKNPETTLFVAESLDPLEKGKLKLGIELKLKENTWHQVQLKRVANESPSKTETNEVEKLVNSLNLENWRPIKS